MNKFPSWLNALVLAILLAGCLFALPNLYGSVEAGIGLAFTEVAPNSIACAIIPRCFLGTLMDFFIQNAYAQGAQQGDSTSFIIMMVLMFAAFYFLLIRPQQKKQKQHTELVAGLQVGDEVLTAGGIATAQDDLESSGIVASQSQTSTRLPLSSIAHTPCPGNAIVRGGRPATRPQNCCGLALAPRPGPAILAS